MSLTIRRRTVSQSFEYATRWLHLACYRTPLRMTALKESIERDHTSALARRQRFLRFPAGNHVEELAG